jgi:hypothetical protein
MGNHHQVDKSQSFVDEGMTLITETDSDRYLDAAAKQRRAKKKEELYAVPEDLQRPSKEFVERWAQ